MKNTIIIGLLFLCTGIFAQSYGPNTPGTVVNVGRGGSNSDLDGLGNLTSDNNVYCFNKSNLGGSGDYTDFFYATNFGFAVNSSYTITGIEVIIQRRDVNGNCKDDIVQLIKAGSRLGNNKALSSSWPATDTDMPYGGATDLWGTTWTPAEVNSSNFGVALSWKRSGGGSTAAIGQVDRVQINIYYSVPLPIELTEANAHCIDNNVVEVNWKTASERNNNYFTLQRSYDAVNFEAAAKIAGAGNSSMPQNYQWIDQMVDERQNVVYYQLQQTDNDGTSKTFPLFIADCQNRDFDFTISPNPVKDEIFVNNLPITAQKIEIINSFGHTIKSFDLDGDSINLNLSSLNSGIYLFKIISSNNVSIKQFVKE